MSFAWGSLSSSCVCCISVYNVVLSWLPIRCKRENLITSDLTQSAKSPAASCFNPTSLLGRWQSPANAVLMITALLVGIDIGRFEQIGRRTMLLNARRILTDAGQTRLVALAIKDITERRRLDETRS